MKKPRMVDVIDLLKDLHLFPMEDVHISFHNYVGSRSKPRLTARRVQDQQFGYNFIETISCTMKFNVGDHVKWNSEAGYVSGTIVKVHTKDFNYKGYIHHATKDDPQYEIKSDKTDHIAAHKGTALKKIK